MINKIDKNVSRLRRHRRVRGKVFGTANKPRLCVFRSLNHIYAQLIDDDSQKTLVSASSVEKSFKFNGGNKEGAREVGKLMGKRCVEKGFLDVVFDRGGYLYHGRVRELADGARECGLKF